MGRAFDLLRVKSCCINIVGIRTTKRCRVDFVGLIYNHLQLMITSCALHWIWRLL